MLLKFLKCLLIVIFLLSLAVYVAFNIFVKAKEVVVDENELLNESTISLSGEQIKMASLVLNKNSNPKFHVYFFFLNDSPSKRNIVAELTAESYLESHEKLRQVNSIDRHIIILATKRYIMKKIDYASCYNYLFSKLYFGNDQYGLSAASEFYCSKSYSELSDKEFISLCLILKNPILYDFSLDKNKSRCEEEANRIYLIYKNEWLHKK